MATIFQAPQQQQQQQQPQQFQTQAQPSTQTNDPLFEALARYITSGPGPSAISSAQIQSILDAHTNDGREYLQSIVQPQLGDDIRVWQEHGQLRGFISTNMTSLTFNFDVRRPDNMSLFRINIRGQAEGFFPPQVEMIENTVFHWDDLHNDNPISFLIQRVQGSFDNSYSITIRSEVYIPEAKPIAELTIRSTSLRLPPGGVSGSGRLMVAE